MFLAPNGELFVTGADRGLLVVDPAVVRDNTAEDPGRIPPAVAVTGATVMGEPVRIDRSPYAAEQPDTEAIPVLQLDPGDTFVSVQFAVLDFAWPSANRLEYRMSSLRTAWQRLGSDGRVNFSNLPPGEHIVEVRGGGVVGPWNDVPTRVMLEVAPAFWETVWFRLAVMLGMIGIAAGILMARHRARRRTERLRRRIADDLHDDLGSKIASVALMLDIAQRDVAEEHVPLLQNALSTARKVARDLRDAIWIIDVSYGTLAGFLQYTRTFAARLSPKLSVRVVIPEGAQAVVLTMERRRHLLLFVKEAVQNAVRHARAATITVEGHIDANEITVTVRDDGEGFFPDDITPGRGLHTMRRRADALSGTMTLDTDSHTGTKVSLTIPIR